jgi:hypothetical protein
MPTYERCPLAIHEQADAVLHKHATHEDTLLAGVKIDFIFAKADRDEESGELLGPAITKNGVGALGLCRIINLRDRTMGRGDVEIMLDMDWWEKADWEEQNALLDHELHHIQLKGGKNPLDDLGRPKIRLRKHDHEFGWFAIVAARNGAASLERQQAKAMMDEFGQYYWDLDTLNNAAHERIASGMHEYDERRATSGSRRTGLDDRSFTQKAGDFIEKLAAEHGMEVQRNVPLSGNTVTFSAPGHAPVTVPAEALNDAAKRLKASAARAKAKAQKKVAQAKEGE